MDYSKWDRLHVDDSDDDSLESDDEPELHATRQRPGMRGTESIASPQRPVDKAKAAAETLLRFKRVERIAEDVLAERQQMIDLERRRNMNREALASLRRIERQGGEVAAGSKHWICLGDVFVKRPHAATRAMLEEDGRRLEAEVEALRTSVKKKTSELCELDPSIAGGSDVHRSFVNLHGVSRDALAAELFRGGV